MGTVLNIDINGFRSMRQRWGEFAEAARSRRAPAPYRLVGRELTGYLTVR